MSEAYIQLPPDSTGKRHRAVQKTVSGNTVYEEVILVDTSLKRNIVGKYIATTPMVSGSTTSGYCYASIFNPAGSGRLIAIKKFRPLCFAAAAAVYIAFTTYRVTSATGGTLLDATAIAKKDTVLDADPVAQIRHTGVTVTTAQRVVSYTSPGAAGYVHFLAGMLEFKDGDEIILREDEGLAVVQEAAGDADFRVFLFVEWDEFTGDVRL